MIEDQNKKIQLFSKEDDINELTQLLNLAYKKWEKLGFKYLAAKQTSDITTKRIFNAKCLIIKDNDKIIATITYYPPLTKVNSEHTLYLQPDVATYGQLAVHPDFQKGGLASQLIKHVEHMAKNDNAKRIIIDTAENNTQLVNYYIKKEYKIIDKTSWSATNYMSVFLSKDL